MSTPDMPDPVGPADTKPAIIPGCKGATLEQAEMKLDALDPHDDVYALIDASRNLDIDVIVLQFDGEKPQTAPEIPEEHEEPDTEEPDTEEPVEPEPEQPDAGWPNPPQPDQLPSPPDRLPDAPPQPEQLPSPETPPQPEQFPSQP